MTTTTALAGYLDWPGASQVNHLERVRVVKGVKSVEVSYGLTSLPRERADAARLLELVRSHWSIENQLFGVRDNLLGEDACRVRSGSAAEALAGRQTWSCVCCRASPGRRVGRRRRGGSPRDPAKRWHYSEHNPTKKRPWSSASCSELFG